MAAGNPMGEDEDVGGGVDTQLLGGTSHHLLFVA